MSKILLLELLFSIDCIFKDFSGRERQTFCYCCVLIKRTEKSCRPYSDLLADQKASCGFKNTSDPGLDSCFMR